MVTIDKELVSKIAASSREVEELAIRVARKESDRKELSSKVSDTAAELSDYILKRARAAG